MSAAKALARATVKGLWIAIPTPFTADGGAVDEDRLGLLGLPQGPVRAPLAPLTAGQERELRADLSALGLV